MFSSLLRKVELIYPRCWTTQAYQRWTKRKLAMSQGEKKKRKAFSSKIQVLKRKGHSRGKYLKNVNVQDLEEQEANGKLTDHEQEDPLKDEHVLASINTSIVNASIASSMGLNVATLDGEDNKKIGEEL